MISIKMQLYLADVYRLQEYHEYVPLSVISEQIGVSLQAASAMLNRLARAGMITQQPYKGIRLSPEGDQVALAAIRRHRIIEVYLVKHMGFGWDEAHHLTDDLHLGVNQDIEDRMDQLADFPKRCPHGEPIPDREGRMPELHDKRLTLFAAGQIVQISRVRAHEPEKLRYLDRFDLKPGTILKIVDQAPFQGPVKILANNVEHTLGYDLASEIWVEPS